MDLDQNMPINLSLPLGQVNIVLAALSTQPYDRVAGLIAEIQRQAAPQVMAAQQPPVPQTAEVSESANAAA
ncbi:MAG: hypothetical protein E6R03_16775 [Hyphomicrobiaceae bacterium]|nr:MAG: hypothetical protein E6R03_16775 [Hyphomicrobiaceae bacterium]